MVRISASIRANSIGTIFLIFPTWDAGYSAIAQLLKTPSYVNLSILGAFQRYAPGVGRQ